MTTYVLDTNVFNKVVEGVFDRSSLPADSSFVVSHVQIEELNNTSDKERRLQLLLTLAQLRPTLVPAESMIWDVSRWDHAKWGDGAIYTQVKTGLDALNKGKAKNIQDALIGEIGIVNGHTLLTADKDLAAVVQSLNGLVEFVSPKALTATVR
ncbi:hypothetical protein GmRootV213_32140 [Variovorax sp. V213]|uniref:hypothetical protein n=1 Tax=Variovorax sp. V213 TaxID=3065955 RepID=UPI0034E89E2D